MGDAAWKRTERAIAARLGGERIPVSGRGRGDAPDIRHERFSLEVKQRRQLPAWIRDALAQAKAAARGDQLPVVILHQLGGRHDGDVVLMTLAAFETLAPGV